MQGAAESNLVLVKPRIGNDTVRERIFELHLEQLVQHTFAHARRRDCHTLKATLRHKFLNQDRRHREILGAPLVERFDLLARRRVRK